jgi:hypothetical protein
MLPPTPTQLYLFQLDFDIKFPFLSLLLFLIDLKSTILSHLEIVKGVTKEILR